MTVSPRVISGGIVLVPSSGPMRTFPLQYNPDSVNRSLQPQATGASGQDRSEALRLKGPATETYTVEAEFDLTDAMAAAATNPGPVRDGLHPQLAFLTGLINPTFATLRDNDALARAGTLEIIPAEAPLTLFVWSRHRIVPVRVTGLTIVEEAFDAALNPIRAKVSLTMRVLTVNDLPYDHPGSTIFLNHLRATERLAAPGSASLSQLGITTIG
ncbi:hypothetical protein F3087_35175 [Nocardia colli]|uniref:Uncharacterized protein n=1 Tax=Nocardia colli TaxID=2545717 RepID=A0A5N0E5E6_9NOCA|nr:hypothetical protein [Nocardia colli]KAA8884196.1 hypothetical protein F3087_35175 [Nocardia colli]